MTFAYKKQVAILLSLVMLLFVFPVPAQAGLGLSFDILSVGPLSLGFDIPWPWAGLFIVGGLLLSFFSDSDSLSASDNYTASYAGPGASAAPPPFSSTVMVRPEDHMRGEPIRMKYASIVHGNTIALVGGGKLVIEDDGKLRFTDTTFHGFAYIQSDDHSLSIWDDQGNPVVVILPRDDKTLILQERSPRSAEVLKILFGAEPEKKP